MIEFQLEDLHPSFTRAVVDTLRGLDADYPEVVRVVKLADLGGSLADSDEPGVIVLNRRWFSAPLGELRAAAKPEDQTVRLNPEVEVMWYGGMEEPQHVLTHEFAHLLQDHLPWSEEFSRIHWEASCRDPTHCRPPSGYALASPEEFFSDTFAAMRLGYDSELTRMLREALDGASRQDSADFKESEHLRGQPDNPGQFVAKGGSRSAGHVVADPSRTAGELLKSGTLPKHIQQIKIPPAWTHVSYSENPDAALQVTGRDVKGRRQAVYHERFKESQAAAKFTRIKELNEKFERIAKQNEEARKSDSSRIRDSADALALIMATGIRPGSDSDTMAKVKAYGATTLEGKHVVKTGAGVALRFVGKKGVELNIPVVDPDIAKMLLQRSKKAGSDGKLFPATNHSALLAHTHSLDGGSFKTKDFRTLLGTRIAMSLVGENQVPKNEKDYRKAVMGVAKKVAAVLGNTPTVALQSYINPVVFSEWRMSIA